MLCEIIIDLLELFGILTQLPSSLLGLTMLSWGNSLGDVFASMSISKNGFGEMALTQLMKKMVLSPMLPLRVIDYI